MLPSLTSSPTRDRRSRLPGSVLRREAVHHAVPIDLTRSQNDLIFPSRNVDGIRKFLRLEAEAGVALVTRAFALLAPVQKRPAVELQTGLVAFQRQHAPGFRI